MKCIKSIIKLCGAVCGIGLALLLTGCSRNTEASKDKLKVGMECSYAPFNWIQPNFEEKAVKISGGWYASGYDVYIAQHIAKCLGKELEIVKVEWDGLLPSLTSGKIDAIIAGMSATEERKQSIDFTDSYYNSHIVIVLKKGSRYENAKSIDEFAGAKVTGQIGTLHYNFIDQMKGADKQVPMDDFSSIISSLNAGKIDCYVSEKPAALTAVHMNPSLTYIDFEEGKGFKYSQEDVQIAIGIRKGSSLKDKLNEVLADISEETKNELMEKAVKKSCIVD